MKMKRRIKALLVLMGATLAAGCGTEQTKEPVPEPEPIEIQIPEPCKYGFITMKTDEGDFTVYSTDINILEDGRDGRAIHIVFDLREIEQ